jgi:GNAT superfamily N-acetyltransferase
MKVKQADEITREFFGVISQVVALMPGAWQRRGQHATRLMVSSLPLPTLNGVFTEALEADAGEVAEFAQTMAGLDLPWSIQVRGEPAPEIEKIATRYGLTQRHTSPLMTREATGPAVRPAPVKHAVRTIDSSEREIFAEVLSAGFEAPIEVLGAFAAPELLDAPWATAYLVEDGGEPVATGYATLVSDHVGLFNIATPPRYRRHGYGRAAAEAAMNDGFAAGARSAFLQSSSDGYPLYERLGFRTIDTWTYFLQG